MVPFALGEPTIQLGQVRVLFCSGQFLVEPCTLLFGSPVVLIAFAIRGKSRHRAFTFLSCLKGGSGWCGVGNPLRSCYFHKTLLACSSNPNRHNSQHTCELCCWPDAFWEE